MEEERAVGLSCALDMFKETDEILELIGELTDEAGSELDICDEAKLDRFKYVIEQYREQSHLLDPHLPRFLDGLVTAARRGAKVDGGGVGVVPDAERRQHQAFKYMHVLVSVRGFKHVVRHLPHDVADLVPVLEMLERDAAENDTTLGGDWEKPYVCLLWLSIIILLPFPMRRLDGGTVDGETPVMDRLMKVLQHYLVSHQSTAIAAGFLASKFLTRPDVMAAGVDRCFFSWAVDTMRNHEAQDFVRLGALRGLNQVYKHGKREDLLPHAASLLREVVNQEFHKQALALRLMSLKLIQRIGLVFLKPKLASWRYRRGCRSLLDSFTRTTNLQQQDNVRPSVNGFHEAPSKEEEDESNEDQEIPDDVEEVIDQLLMGLKDADSQVRWSSAKGIGRVTGRLPKQFADDVINSLLDFFSLRESDSAWHGGCLALAELGRRGFLLPTRLPEVVKVVLEALVFDEARGYYSVGINVRDAACYVVWAFARAYEPIELAPFVGEIAAQLLVVCCFDREVKGRLAASAAFQENVGRVGTFPHGIDILTMADFVSVANRKNAFLNISTFIASFDEYRQPLLSHLMERKINHWDAAIRDLASKALHSIGLLDPAALKHEYLPRLLAGLDSTEINVKHGALLSLAEAVHALAKKGEETGLGLAEVLGPVTVKTLCGIVDRLEEKKAFRLMGAHLMREASSHFIMKCAESGVPLHSPDGKDRWLQHLYANLSQAELPVREAAARALAAFCRCYVEGDAAAVAIVLKKCLHEALLSRVPVTRMGFSFAIGEFGSGMMPSPSDRSGVFISLAAAFRPPRPDGEPAMILGRRDALDASRKLITSVGLGAKEDAALASSTARNLFDAYLDALTDYTIDKPGDVGAWVRQAALDAIVTLVDHCVSEGFAHSVIDAELGTMLVQSLAKQACERIDKVRLLAAKRFLRLVHSGAPALPQIDELRHLFPQGVEEDWTNYDNFAQFVGLVRFAEYRKAVLSGLVFSIGDVGQKASQVATDCLLRFLREYESNQQLVRDVFESLVEMNEEAAAKDDERVVGAMMASWDKLLPSGAFDEAVVRQSPECLLGRRLVAATKKVLTGRRVVVTRVVAGACLWCSLVGFRDVVIRQQAWSALTLLLTHKYPRVRKCTAEQMYETLAAAPLLEEGELGLVLNDEDGRKTDEILKTLSDTTWNDDDDLDGLRKKRDRLRILLELPAVALKRRDAISELVPS